MPAGKKLIPLTNTAQVQLEQILVIDLYLTLNGIIVLSEIYQI